MLLVLVGISGICYYVQALFGLLGTRSTG
ncbi:hypothetical protein LINGRAHAP2_LOCUS32940 [Linum grandiflorum]